MLRVGSVSGAVPSLQGGPARPAAGQPIHLGITLTNTGGTGADFALTGQLVLGGTSTHEGYLFPTPNPTAGQTPNPATGTLAANGGSASVTLYSGGIATADQFANYDSTKGLDALLTLTDTDSGEAATVRLPSAVFAAAPAPAALAIVAVTIAVG